jgi:seryl-tRNA synthetase
VPDGESDADNVEVRVWGEAKNFDFIPMSHMDIMEKRDWVDFDRGSKAAGFRGYFLKGDAALLEMALWLWGMDRWQKKGFMPMIVPSLVRKEALMGTGYLPGGEDDLYKDGEDYLSGTGEVATMFYHSDEIIDFKTGPKKFVAFSPCFRKEIGSYSKDVKASHEESVRLHEEITRNSEEMLEELGISYHTVINCAGDLGQGQVKKYDIEAWVPSQSKYRETHSASYFHDYQTRRLNIRYKDNEGKLKFAHSLNNTALATPRLLAILIENYQNADGSVTVPEVLRNYMGGREII